MTMTSISVRKAGTQAGFVPTILSSAARLWRAWQHRRQITGLLGADDHMLADIGLTRADVIGALSSPIDADPSYHLIRARGERMSARARRLPR